MAPADAPDREPVDPDTAVPGTVAPRAAPERLLPVVAAVSAGGGLGAAARYGADRLWPTAAAGFPWTTLAVNALGCALLGALMALLAGARRPHRLLGPFAGTGLLGGFTTFSAYAVEFGELLRHGRAAAGAGYLAGTLLAALGAVWAAATAARRLTAGRRR